MGPTYRADLWAVLETDPDLSAADLARAAYASFASAWQVKRDFNLLFRSLGAAPAAPQNGRVFNAPFPTARVRKE